MVCIHYIKVVRECASSQGDCQGLYTSRVFEMRLLHFHNSAFLNLRHNC
jgi:hypothetical protein